MEFECFDPAETHAEAYQKAAAAAAADDPATPNTSTGDTALPDPRPLPSGLSPVLSLTPDMLPTALKPWLLDITERVSCPLEFPAVAAVAAAGAVLGRKVGIHPKGQDDWYEHSNLWALLIGRPSMMKTPAMDEALRPLRSLAAAAEQAYREEERSYREALVRAKIERDVAVQNAKKAVKAGQPPELSALLEDPDAAPTMRRYTATDTSAESLVELCRQNPNGILLVADEMSGLLALLDRPGNESLRALYLKGWNGKSGHILDRVGRGMNIGAPFVCMGILGGIQPDVLRRNLFDPDSGSVDDGFTQRFQLAVWPDDSGKWKFVDRWPNTEARTRVQEVFASLDSLDACRDLKATLSDAGEDRPPCLRFADEAREKFAVWMAENHGAGRLAGETCPALEAMHGKYRKLVPALALLFHVIDGGTGPVGTAALDRAIHWAAILATHGQRVFDAGNAQTVITAHRIIAKLRDGGLRPSFKVRDVYRPQWSGLKDRRLIEAALAVLEHHGWVTVVTMSTGGHPLETFTVHPKVLESPPT